MNTISRRHNVYRLQSIPDPSFGYTGVTSNLHRRIAQHNRREKSIPETVRAANAIGLKTKSYQTRTGKWNGDRSSSILKNPRILGQRPPHQSLHGGLDECLFRDKTKSSWLPYFLSSENHALFYCLEPEHPA
jgi:hypothetical protein